MAKKERIPINAENAPELNNPFANLQIDNLPTGDTPAPQAPPSTRASRRERSAQSLGRVVLRKETAHRGGKTVIVIHDFASSIPTQSIENLGRKLRAACGCGGTTRERAIEIQGNQVDKIRAFLEAEGYRVAGVK